MLLAGEPDPLLTLLAGDPEPLLTLLAGEPEPLLTLLAGEPEPLLALLAGEAEPLLAGEPWVLPMGEAGPLRREPPPLPGGDPGALALPVGDGERLLAWEAGLAGALPMGDPGALPPGDGDRLRSWVAGLAGALPMGDPGALPPGEGERLRGWDAGLAGALPMGDWCPSQLEDSPTGDGGALLRGEATGLGMEEGEAGRSASLFSLWLSSSCSR